MTASGSYTATYTSASGCAYTSAPVAVTATTPLAARATWEADGLVLAPNPAHGTISCTVPGLAGATRVQATLLNSLGQAVHTQAAALPAGGIRLVLDARPLAPGLYSLRLQAGATTLTKKVIVD
ncbi:MAG: T9SS type A sorting domain-containing protein [Hymenobacter sp.]|nr:MAG: T9SS type A sorting domain-containing protein [Hymenobacter sp.]